MMIRSPVHRTHAAALRAVEASSRSRQRNSGRPPARGPERVERAFSRSATVPWERRVSRTRTADCVARAVASDGWDGRVDESEEPSQSTRTWFERLLKLPSDGSAIWVAPWGVKTTVSVMVIWFCFFFIIGNAVFPFIAGLLGFDSQSFTQRGLAVYSLCLDMAQMAMTGFVLRQSLRSFSPIRAKFFPFRWFEDRKQLRDVALACVAFPFVVWLHGLSLTVMESSGLLVFDESVTTGWEQSMRSNDLLSKSFYVLLASFAAPVWEELIFRGFLFASLTSVTTTTRAMIISSVVFALAHVSMEQFLPLTFLGCLHCVVFTRTRNLLAPVLVHSAWNAWVLAGDFLPPLLDVARAVFSAPL